MASFNSEQYRAIQHVANKNGWKLSLSTCPTVYFIAKDGSTVKRNIHNVVGEYLANQRADKKAAKLNGIDAATNPFI